MIHFENGGRLVQSLNELPNLRNAKNLYLDTETTSFDRKEKAFKPWHGHRICGVAATADEKQGAWYIPVRCNHEKWNLPLEPVIRWVDDTINSCEDWVNHNVKFDAHFLKQDGINFNCRLVDTNTLAKIVNSDRFSYELGVLSREWLEEDTSSYEDRLKALLTGCKSKDYGGVPGDMIGEYGCQDVITNRKLYKYLLRRRHEQTVKVWETEILLTPVLFDMEVTGLHVDLLELQKEQLKVLYQLSKLEEQLHGLTGFPIRPHTNPDCYEALCNKYGLPVLGRTEKKEPSFDKAVMISYRAHPLVRDSELLTKIVTKIQKYRKLHTLHSFFIKPYIEHQVDGVMHPDHNQCVNTGRLSCRRPNAQQLSLEAKTLVHPPKGEDVLSWDYKQSQFRLIVHYIKDQKAIEAYRKDPNTDFHQWVSSMCGIPRKPAKNVNFAVAFGGGKTRVVSMLALDMELMKRVADRVDELVVAGKINQSQKRQVFELLCNKKGEAVYQEYHDTLPGIKRVSKNASNNLVSRGYVFNAYGRQRHLPARLSYRSFVSIIQSCEADMIKERTVAIAPRYNSYVKNLGINIFASVHDETAQYVPKGLTKDLNVMKKLQALFEDVGYYKWDSENSKFEKNKTNFRVSMKVGCGASSKNWAIASSDEGKIKL